MTNPSRPTFTLDQILTIREVQIAHEIWQRDRGNFRVRVRDDIIKPNMQRINDCLNQANDPDYLSYVVEYVFSNTLK